MKPNFFLITLIAACLAVSCKPDVISVEAPEEEEQDEVQIGVDISIHDGTRSSVTAGESDMKNVTIFQFRPDGVLHRAYYFSSLSSGISVSGKSGVTYAFCALMNMGDRRTEIAKLSELESFKYTVSPMSELDSSTGLPMASGLQYVDFSDTPSRITLEFTRLVCRVDFRFSTESAVKGSFELKSVSIRQAPISVRPFVQGNRPSGSYEVSDGDCADASDILTLSEGGSLSLYVLENCQGNLLSGNHNPRLKIPSSIPSKENVCTYLEVKADYATNDGVMVSSNTYRMYLGEDNCSNFDLTRNTIDNVTLSLSDWTRADNYWKAEWNVTYRALPSVVLDVPDVEVGQTLQASVTAVYADGSVDSDPYNFNWSCTGAATVTPGGLVTGTGNGQFTVTAEYIAYDVEGSDSARSQAFRYCEFDFGGFYDVEVREDEDYGSVRYEDGVVTVTMEDEFGYSVSCSCPFTVGIAGYGKSAIYVSFESGEATPGYGKIVDGGYVRQSVSSTIGTAYLAPGSEVPIWLQGQDHLISEEVGIIF